MCGRYNDHLPKMIGWVDALKEWPKFTPSYNVTPTSDVVAFRGESGELMRWGIIPPWSKEFGSKYATFNARIETVANKPTFRNAWNKSQRCLIPMAGYYEWCGDKGNKQPFYITDRDTGGLVVAGLYESWGNNKLSCTVLTMPADDELNRIHPRQPVILTPKTTNDWLSDQSGKENLTNQERPNVIYYPVSKAVGNIRNDSLNLTEPIDIN